ncbi:TerD family protein [Dactylosporangium sp. NBC_01737]|uniref:TerD family protein n=1 Tax=Dactylosporangium sp. NBC_01737 TaxID=2975959 RepID=UPI002E1541DA|nr:TerD family protein [Dactylosporangium sp. NBC_01737]
MATVLVKGQNTALTANDVRVVVEVGVATDLSALLVTTSGKVRSDADFVFYNQPSGPGVSVSDSGGGKWQASVSTAAIPADVDKVRVVVSVDGTGQRFGQFAPPVARVFDQSGAELIQYVVSGLDTESIVIALEIYRRNADWKVRAVGQGYAGGLADLIRDHGVSVDDSPAPAATPAPQAAPPVAAPPVAAPPVAAPQPAQPTPPPPPAAPVYTMPAQTAPARRAPQETPAYGQNVPQHNPQQGYPPQTPPAPPGPPAYGQQPPAPAYGQQPPPPPPYGQQQPPTQQMPPVAPPQPAAPPQDAPVGGPGGRINLSKGQRVSLRKQDGTSLSLVRMGLGWDPIKKRGLFGNRETEVDLDASAILFADHQPVDIAFFNQLRSKDGSVQHAGDNRTGAGDGDDESIVVDLNRVPAHVTTIIFVVTSYEGHTFAQIEAAFCRLVDETTRAELTRYTLSGGTPSTGMVMAKLHRDGGTWKMTAIGEPQNAKQPLEMIPQLARFL